MRWSIRKNAADRPTIETLKAQRSDTQLEIEGLESERQEIDASLPSLREFEPGRAADAEDRKTAIAVEIANRQRRLAYIDEGIAKLEAEAAEKAGDKRAVEKERQAATDAKKLPSAALSAGNAFIAAIEAMVASNDRTAEYNEQRGNRPFVVDCETRARQIPGQTIPARFEEREFWRDGSGREPMQFRKNERGELVPIEAGFTKVRERICVQPERFIPPTMPPRLAELLPVLRKALGA